MAIKGWQGFAVLFLAVSGTMYYGCRPKLDNSIDQRRPAPRASNLKNSRLVQVPLPSESGTTGTSRLKELRLAYDTKMMSGLIEIPTRSSGKVFVIGIRTATEAQWCRTGDFDLFKALTDFPKEKEFLVSIEPISGSDGKFFKQRMSLIDMLDGKAMPVPFLKDDNARDYGLYICYDPKNTNRCSDKASVSPRDWDQLVRATKKPARTLYYQTLTLRSGRAFLLPSTRWDQASVSTMKNRLSEILEDSETTINRLEKMSSTLGSMQATVVRGSLSLPLPYKNPRCP